MVRSGEIFLKSDTVKYTSSVSSCATSAKRWKRLVIPAVSRALGEESLFSGEKPEEIGRHHFQGLLVLGAWAAAPRIVWPTPRPCVMRLWLLLPHTCMRHRGSPLQGDWQSKTGMNSQPLGEFIGSAIYDAIPGLTVDLRAPGV